MRSMLQVLLFVGLFASPISAQWRQRCQGGQCDVSQVSYSYVWRNRSDTPNESYLFIGNVQVGAYDHSTRVYLPIVNEQWTEPAAPPISVPDQPIVIGQAVRERQEPGPKDMPLPTGVDNDKLGEERYILNGRPSSRREAIRCLNYGCQLEDDSHKPHLTIATNSEAKRAAVEADLASPKLASELKKVRLQLYSITREADRIILEPFRLDEDEGFRKSGIAIFTQPASTETGQAPVTAVYQYAGPDSLLDAIRKADPNFNPNKPHPDSKKGGKQNQDPQNHMVPLCCVAGAAVLILANRKRKS